MAAYLPPSVAALLPWAALSLSLWLAVYAWRRLLPASWRAMERLVPAGAPAPLARVLLALPSVALGAALGAYVVGGTPTPGEAWAGAVAGSLAPFLHHALKALPVPYQGPAEALAPGVLARIRAWLATLGGVVGACLLLGCGGAPPRPTTAEAACVARAAARAELLASACGEYVEGACATDAIVDRQVVEIRECFR